MIVLKDIGSEMVKQDNRSTQYPLYVVQEDERRMPTLVEDADGYETDEDGDKIPYIDKPKIALEPGVFFTAKACQEHIDENSYHYTNPRVYAIAAWRNPEVQTIMQSLIKDAGQKVPIYYS